jgi:hypothetical protein
VIERKKKLTKKRKKRHPNPLRPKEKNTTPKGVRIAHPYFLLARVN